MRGKVLVGVRRAIYAAGALYLALNCGAQAGEQLKIAIVSRTVFYVPAWIAERKGFFKTEGIDVEIKVYDNAEDIDRDLRANVAQISISTPESVVGDVYRGGALRIVAGNAQKLPHFVITKKEITSLAGLRGARVGVLSMKEGTTYLVQHLARIAGLMPNEYHILAVGGAPTRWRLMKEGKIDAGLQPFPLSYEAEAAGFNNLGPVLYYIPDYQFTSVNVESGWAKSNADKVVAVLRALRNGQQYMEQHPQEAAEIAAQELRTQPALAVRALNDTARMRILSEDLSVSKPGLEYVFRSLQSAGLVAADAVFEFERIVDHSYLKRLEK